MDSTSKAFRLWDAIETEIVRHYDADNLSAAQLLRDVQRACNTLLDRDAAALFDRIVNAQA